jgi:hypothetical protein
MYARSGLGDKRLADWSRISGQGTSGGRQLIFSAGSLTSRGNYQSLQLCQERCVEVHQIVAQALHEDENESSSQVCL